MDTLLLIRDMKKNNNIYQSKSPIVLPPIYSSESRFTSFSMTSDVDRKAYASLDRRSFSQCYDQPSQIPQIPYRIHSGFTADEIKIIKEALKIVSKRLFKRQIIKNMYEHSNTKGFCFGLDVWQRSNLSKHSSNHGAYYLLEYQLTSLKMKYENNHFPLIHIRPICEQSNVSGRGFLSTVQCVSHSSQSLINGQFQIYLNRYQLQQTKMTKSDLISWAGVIVHEMLHNLGHNHHVGDYSNRWQINLFTKCFEHNGRY